MQPLDEGHSVEVAGIAESMVSFVFDAVFDLPLLAAVLNVVKSLQVLD